MQPITAISERVAGYSFPTPEPLPPPLLVLDQVAVGYNTLPVLRKLDLRLDADDRIALLGANGEGKSTLSKLLADRLDPYPARCAHQNCVLDFLPSINLMNWCRASRHFNICNDCGLKNCQHNCAPDLGRLALVRC